MQVVPRRSRGSAPAPLQHQQRELSPWALRDLVGEEGARGQVPLLLRLQLLVWVWGWRL